MYVVVCAFFTCISEDCSVYGACGFECGASVFADELSKVRVEVWKFGCGAGVVLFVVECCGPCSEAADGGVGLRERDVREDVSIDYPPCTRICCIVVGNSRVGFDFTYVGCEAMIVPCFNVVVGFIEEVAVRVVFVVEWVDYVISHRVDAKGAVCEDVELGGVLVRF